METRRWLVGVSASSLLLAGALLALPATGIARQEATPVAGTQLLQPQIELADALATALEGQDGATVRSVSLDNWDETVVYGMVLDNGAEVYLDAGTGEVIVALDPGSASPIEPTISVVEAQEAAIAGQAGASVKKLTLQDWDGVLTYEVALDNGADVEVDAMTGDVLDVD